MARSLKVTITITPEAQAMLARHAKREYRYQSEVARFLLDGALHGLEAAEKDGTSSGVLDFSRQIGRENDGPEPVLDAAELRVGSRDALLRLEGLLDAAGGASRGLRQTLEHEVQAARHAKVRRLRAARVAAVRA